jgi:hypothetical protein
MSAEPTLLAFVSSRSAHAERGYTEAVATTAPAGDSGAWFAGPRSRVEARVAEELRQALEEMGRELRAELP